MTPLIGIVRNWSLLAFAQVASSVFALVVMIYVSRRLGDAEFGRLFIALTLTTLVGVLVDLGLSQLVVRAVSRDRTLARPYLRRGVLVVGVLGSVLYALLLAVLRALGFAPELWSLVLIVGLLMIVEGIAQLLGAVFQAHERMLIPALARLGANVLTLALVVPLLALGQGALAVGAVMVLVAVVRVAAQLIVLRRLEGFRGPVGSTPPWRSLVRGGTPFLAAQALGLVVAKIDVPILGRLAGEAAVGWYAASSRLMEAFNFVPIMLLIAMFPVLSRLWVTEPDEFASTVRKMLRLLVVITVPAAVTLLVLSREVIGFLFTLDSYEPAVPILRIQAFSLALVFIDYVLTCALMAMGRERLWLAILVAATAVNVALNLALIPFADATYGNGAIGAALATLATEVVILVSASKAVPSGILTLETAGVALRAAALGIVLAVTLVGMRAIAVPWPLAGAVGVGGYVAIAMHLRLLPPDITAWARDVLLRRRRTARPGEGSYSGEAVATKADAA